MKKTLLILPIFLVAIFFGTVSAQENTLTAQITTAEADYRFQFDQYRSAYQNYIVSKAGWEKDKTLIAEQAALNNAKAVAVARSKTLRAYTQWVRLRLLNLVSVYPQAQEYADQLNTLSVWYQTHEASIASTTSLDAFDQVMNSYYFERLNRQKIYTSAQIALKLSELASIQHESRSLYDPILTALRDKQSIPQVQQGLIHIAQIGDRINTLITETNTIIGSIQSEDLAAKQASQKASDKLDAIRSAQLELIGFITELEANYYGN